LPAPAASTGAAALTQMADLFHIGLTVSDIDRSLRFYVDVVGLDEASPVDHASDAFDRLTGNPGSRMLSVMLSGGTFLLQLNQYLAGGGATLDLHHNAVGSPHLAFFVADVDAHQAALVRRGDVTITSPVVNNASGTLRSFYVEDPDGVPVEFLQRLRLVDYHQGTIA
jgi:catechol 2,3-dioxygenase-like lactoylglutathione lyase family enzyme